MLVNILIKILWTRFGETDFGGGGKPGVVTSGVAIGRGSCLSGRAGCGLSRAHNKDTLRKKKNAA